MLKIKFTKKFKPEIESTTSIPDQIIIENQVKCPKCNFPATHKVALATYDGTSRTKYQCIICGHKWGD